MNFRWILLTILLVLTFGGCSLFTPETGRAQAPTPLQPAKSPSEAAVLTPSVEPSIQGTEMNPSLPIPAAGNIQALVEKAKEDLSQRQSIFTSEIKVMESKEVIWPDTSLGCPQPGTAYTQIATRGYLIRLEANGREFEYHANIHNYVFYCENPMPPVLGTPSGANP